LSASKVNNAQCQLKSNDKNHNWTILSFEVAEVHFEFDGRRLLLQLLPSSSHPQGGPGGALAGTDGGLQLLFQDRGALHDGSEGHWVSGANLHEPLENVILKLCLLLSDWGRRVHHKG